MQYWGEQSQKNWSWLYHSCADSNKENLDSLVYCLWDQGNLSVALSNGVQVGHTYQENNQAADFLANLGCQSKQSFLFSYFSEFPRLLRGLWSWI